MFCRALPVPGPVFGAAATRVNVRRSVEALKNVSSFGIDKSYVSEGTLMIMMMKNKTERNRKKKKTPSKPGTICGQNVMHQKLNKSHQIRSVFPLANTFFGSVPKCVRESTGRRASGISKLKRILKSENSSQSYKTKASSLALSLFTNQKKKKASITFSLIDLLHLDFLFSHTSKSMNHVLSHVLYDDCFSFFVPFFHALIVFLSLFSFVFLSFFSTLSTPSV